MGSRELRSQTNLDHCMASDIVDSVIVWRLMGIRAPGSGMGCAADLEFIIKGPVKKTRGIAAVGLAEWIILL